MYYALNKTTRLRKEKECVVLFSAENTGALRYVHPVYAMVLAACDGHASEADLLGVLTAEPLAFETGRAEELLGKILRETAGFLTASTLPREPREARRRYSPLDFFYRPEGDPRLHRLSAPLDVAWLVTERCPYDCVYCCIRTAPAHPVPASELTTEEAFHFLADCVRSGVQVVTFHGGEPFLRRDLPELIAFLLERGVHVSVSTKLRLAERVAAQLAEAGLEELQVSLDSPVAATAAELVGHEGYLETAEHNIRLLLRHGIAPKINTVVTRRNAGDIPDLVRRIYALGARRMSLSGYLRSFWKHDDALLPGGEALAAMAEEVWKIADELPDLAISMCPLQDPREISLATPGLSACSGGRSGLVVGADGRVSLCDRLLPFPEAIVGNVRESSLLEIWHGGALRAFVTPEESAYEGTQCQSCGLWEACNRRIRCYYRSLMISGRLFSPDFLCPAMPAPEARFF